jgi:hypothetical protein
MRQTHFATALAVYLGVGFASAAKNSTNVSSSKPLGAVSAGSPQSGLKQIPGGQLAVAASGQQTQALKPIPGTLVAAATLEPLKPLVTTSFSIPGTVQTLSVTTTSSPLAVLVTSTVCVDSH